MCLEQPCSFGNEHQIQQYVFLPQQTFHEMKKSFSIFLVKNKIRHFGDNLPKFGIIQLNIFRVTVSKI